MRQGPPSSVSADLAGTNKLLSETDSTDDVPVSLSEAGSRSLAEASGENITTTGSRYHSRIYEIVESSCVGVVQVGVKVVIGNNVTRV